MKIMTIQEKKIAIIGLGYVGLPLAIEFGKKYFVKGFDINEERIFSLKNGEDSICEISKNELLNNIIYTSNPEDLRDCNIFIVTVPTPIDKYKSPDLGFLIDASKMIGQVLKKNDIVIFESTVYPGCTEEECVPILERTSNLKYNFDFFCGYSPERINPGDKVNTLTKIKKVTSGSNNIIAKIVDELYKSIIEAGTHMASSIKIAEASKAIENAQRDINISFVNELALIFDKMDIDTQEVLNAAATKWNFLNFKPGLVGGHCIGVDPYYLAHKAESLGYYPNVILSGRRVNDNMGIFIANKSIKLLIKKGNNLKGSNALILGVTFKENCPDIRNSKVFDIYNELVSFEMNVDVYDPIANPDLVMREYNINLITKLLNYDLIILAVPHICFTNLKILELKKSTNSVIFDIKGMLSSNIADARL